MSYISNDVTYDSGAIDKYLTFNVAQRRLDSLNLKVLTASSWFHQNLGYLAVLDNLNAIFFWLNGECVNQINGRYDTIIRYPQSALYTMKIKLAYKFK